MKQGGTAPKVLGALVRSSIYLVV